MSPARSAVHYVHTLAGVAHVAMVRGVAALFHDVERNGVRRLEQGSGHSTGAMRSMSAWQWRGASGSSWVDTVMRTSVPQIGQR